MTEEEMALRREQAHDLFRKAAIVISAEEQASIETQDFELGDYERIGLAILVYVNYERYCAKELALLPRQTCPQHRHPPLTTNVGKQETFRCRWGTVYLNVPGEPSNSPGAIVPGGPGGSVDVFHEIVLKPGDQFTLPPNTFHWFQAGDEGAVLSEFSSISTDENDQFLDPAVQAWRDRMNERAGYVPDHVEPV
jgi:D-lyxose ketol-isomerase